MNLSYKIYTMKVQSEINEYIICKTNSCVLILFSLQLHQNEEIKNNKHII